MLDYSKSGPGAFTNVMPPVYEKLEGQMKLNGASDDEVEKFINELNLFQAAALSFPERRNKLHA